MRHALLFVLFGSLLTLVQAHKAIDDEADIPEELIDNYEQVKREMTDTEKARMDPNFFDGLDSIKPVEQKNAMYYITHYQIEGVAMLFFVFCFINLFMGKRKNSALA